jgi:hypothetical protein
VSILYTLCILASLAFVYQWFARITLENARFKDGLIYGMGATFIVQSIVQDIVGQQAYINLVTVSWVSGWYTVPLALIALFIMAGLLFVGFRIAIPANEKARREEEQKKKDNDNG